MLDTPSLEMNFGNRALKETELINVSLVLGHLLRLSPEQFLPYGRYFRALGLLAKNDLLGQFHHPLMIEFSEALKAAFTAYGDWDGKPETLDAAVDRVFGSFGSDFLTEVKRTLQLAKRQTGEKQTSVPIDVVLELKALSGPRPRLGLELEIESKMRWKNRGGSKARWLLHYAIHNNQLKRGNSFCLVQPEMEKRRSPLV